MEPRWLKLKIASKYSSIGEKRLISLAESGRIKGFPDPDDGRHAWIFDRRSIDSYREAQAMESSSGEREALAIWSSLRQ